MAQCGGRWLRRVTVLGSGNQVGESIDLGERFLSRGGIAKTRRGRGWRHRLKSGTTRFLPTRVVRFFEANAISRQSAKEHVKRVFLLRSQFSLEPEVSATKTPVARTQHAIHNCNFNAWRSSSLTLACALSSLLNNLDAWVLLSTQCQDCRWHALCEVLNS